MENIKIVFLTFLCLAINADRVIAAEPVHSSAIEQLNPNATKHKVDKRIKMLCKVLRTPQQGMNGRTLQAIRSIKDALPIVQSVPSPIADLIFTRAYKLSLADIGIAFSSYENEQEHEVVVYENNAPDTLLDFIKYERCDHRDKHFLRSHKLENCTSQKNINGFYILDTPQELHYTGETAHYCIHEPSANNLLIAVTYNPPPFGDVLKIELYDQKTNIPWPPFSCTGLAQDISDGHTIRTVTVDQRSTVPKIAFLSYPPRDNTKVTSSILRTWQKNEKVNRSVLPGRFTKVVHLPTLNNTLLGLHGNGDLSIIGLNRGDSTYNDTDVQLFKQKLSFLNMSPMANKKIVDIAVNPQVPAMVALLVATSDTYLTNCQSVFELYTALFASNANKKVFVRKVAEFSNKYVLEKICNPNNICLQAVDTKLYFRDAVLNIRNKISALHAGTNQVIAHTSRFLYCAQIFDSKNRRATIKTINDAPTDQEK
ncbi:MAG: hypothetical protein WCE21_01940 [Candidatus Babeliales bacterium]